MNIASPVLYVFPLFANTVIGLLLALFIFRHSSAPRSFALVALILAASLWSFGYAMEFASHDVTSKLLWARFQYFGITAVPTAWLFFTFQYIGAPGWASQSTINRLLILTIPLLTVIFVWTNELHGLIWRQVQLQDVGELQILAIRHGPWFWLFVVYSYILLVWSSARLVAVLINSLFLHRWQIWLVIIAIIIPWITNLVYTTGHSPIPFLDPTPFSFTIAGLLITISLFRFYLVKISPIAYQAVISGMTDSVLILDMHDHVVDLNPTAHKLFNQPDIKAIGEPLARLVPELSACVTPLKIDEEHSVEFTRSEGDRQRVYELRVSPLSKPYPWPVGRLLVCHDITQRKQVQNHLEQVVSQRTETLHETITQLQQSRDQLRIMALRLQAVQEIERRRIAEELHDRVGQNLTGMNLSLQSIHNQLNSTASPEILERLDVSQHLVEDTTHIVRQLMTDLRPPMLEEDGLLPALQWFGNNFSQRTGLSISVHGDEIVPRLPLNTEMVIFRIVQEALHNTAKHAQANQSVITVKCSPQGNIIFQIQDNGRGFYPQALDEPTGQPHWGIVNMKQRAASIGGQLSITSVPSQGTQVTLILHRGDKHD